MQKIREQIKAERIKLKLTSRKLAELAETNHAQIINFENGKANITTALLERICDALGVEISITSAS